MRGVGRIDHENAARGHRLTMTGRPHLVERPVHLVERVAAQLRGSAGLAEPDPAPDFSVDFPTSFAADPLPSPALPSPALDEDIGDSEVPDSEVPDGEALDMAALKRAGLALAGMRSRTTEEYRITVGRILRALQSGTRTTPGSPNQGGLANLVMVTSARPGEGKSFSTLNLGASIAQNGLADVLLVDVDGKPRSMTTLLGLRERQGLLDLVGNATLRPEDLVVRTAIPGFSVLPLGLNRSATAEGGVTRAVIAAIERVRRRFPRHILLLDTAPCLSTSDPSTLAPLVDQVIMVVEAGRTQRAELGAGLELVRACPNVILVLNKVRLTHRHSFGSYYYFGYPS
jgi:protein-tyrosine kinase